MKHAKPVVDNGEFTLRNGTKPLRFQADRIVACFDPPASLDSGQILDTISSIVHGRSDRSSLPLTGIVLPGDSLAIPVSGQPNELGQILVPLIAEFEASGVPASTIRIVCRSEHSGHYREILPSNLEIETHEPETEENSAYLANSRRGSRVYLNRKMLDCDVILPVIVPEPVGLSMRRGVMCGFWPEFSRSATEAKFREQYAADARKARHEIREVAWLAGVSAVIVGLPGAGGIADLGGMPPASAQAWFHERVESLWGFDFDPSADSVLIVEDEPEGLSHSRMKNFLDLARKLAVRYRRVVLWARFDESAIDAMEQEIRTDSNVGPGWLSRLQRIGRSAKISCLGNLTDDIADACEIVLLDRPEDLERQVNHSGRWIVVPDAWAVRGRFED